jgi:hypothetical protein
VVKRTDVRVEVRVLKRVEVSGAEEVEENGTGEEHEWKEVMRKKMS